MAWMPALLLALLGPSETILPAEQLTAIERFIRTSAPIQIDGKLDEASWAHAGALDHFFEVHPGHLEAPRFGTEGRLLFDNQFLYIGITAFDPEPYAIRTSFVRRDQIAADQDYIERLVDPTNAQKSATFFRANPQGVQTDGTYIEESSRHDLAPDFRFDVAARITDDGWVAEFRIPLASLRFMPGPEQAWTFVIYRNVPRAISMTISSVPVPRSSTCLLCHARPVAGISLERPDATLSIVPHITYTHHGNADLFEPG